MIGSLNKLETDLIDNWKVTVSKRCEELLKLPLFDRRSKCNELQLNLHPEVTQIYFHYSNFNVYLIIKYIFLVGSDVKRSPLFSFI